MVARNLLAVCSILVLAGCGTTSQCSSGRTIWYEDTDGTVKSRAETFTCPTPSDIGPASNSSGIFSEGELAPPEPGKAWWD